MKITIDEKRCDGHKRCFNLYPQLFEEGPDGKGCVRCREVPEEDEVDAQSAANACPNGAIELEYD